MKSIRIENAGAIRNELNKYKHGRKLDISQFNQVARLAWLGKLVLQPLDPEDAECRALLVYAQEPSELAAHVLDVDGDLLGHMHVVDGEQGRALIEVLRQGVQERARLYQELKQRDFYFAHFYHGDDGADADGE